MHTEPVDALPKTVNRLFVTSLVLMAITTEFSVSDPDSTFFIFGITPMGISIFINHLGLWHLANKEVGARSMFVEDQAKDPKSASTSRASSPTMASATPIRAYPMCLIGLPNIIWTFLTALFMLGLMWVPILSASTALYFNSGWDYGNRWNFLAASLMQGIFGYAECGVLFTLFGIYVRERKRFSRGKIEMHERNVETKA